MALDSKDLEAIERLIARDADNLAVSIVRSFERLEERIDGAEARIYNHIVEVEDKCDALRSEVRSSAF